jgi:hypothetical protein
VLAFVIRVEECFSLYIMLSIILQLYALGTLIVGVGVAVESDSIDPYIKIGKFDFWFQ